MSKNNISSINFSISNYNMSDIKEMVSEENSNFQKELNDNVKSQSEISEIIHSASISNYGITRSRPQTKTNEQKNIPKRNTSIQVVATCSKLKRNTSIKIPIITQQEKLGNKGQKKQEKQENQEQIKQKSKEQGERITQNKKPVFLGEKIFNVIKERYHQFNPVNTQDPNILYNFYILQRKNFKFDQKNKKTLQQILNKSKGIIPSMRRKAVVKAEFQNLLSYYPQDIYYTLCCQSEIIMNNRQTSQKCIILKDELERNKQKRHNNKTLHQTITRLYGPQIKKQVSKTQDDKINKFGKKLSEHFQNKFGNTSVQTAEKLYNFWEDVCERQQYGIQWQQDTAKQTIRLYMKKQVENLMEIVNKKLGFKAEKVKTIYQFYKNNTPIEGVYIPQASFIQYLKIYNQFEKQESDKQNKLQIKRRNHCKSAQKQRQIKMFGRPVSATPLTILAQRKDHNNVKKLIQKYPNDQYIRNLIISDHLKKPRHSLQYGIFNIEDEIKTKQRVKPKKEEKMNLTIEKMVRGAMTFSNIANFKKKDAISAVFQEDYLETDQSWKTLGPILFEAMFVKAFEEQWFRECLLKYSQKVLGKNLKTEDNKKILKDIFDYLNKISQSQRRDQLNNLQIIIEQSQAIAEKLKKIEEIKGCGNNEYLKQKQKCIKMIQQKARDHIMIKQKIKRNQYQKDYMLRTFMNQFYAELLKECKDYVVKEFHVTSIQKQCPKLLKFQLFRIQKQINLFNLQRDKDPKSHAWIPPKKSVQNLNYKTFNQFGSYYVKNKLRIIPQPQKKRQSITIWGRKKAKDRQKVLMTYSDAENCIFHPMISKKKF